MQPRSHQYRPGMWLELPTAATIPTGARNYDALAAASLVILDESQLRWARFGPMLGIIPRRPNRLRSLKQPTVRRTFSPALSFGVRRKSRQWSPLGSRPIARSGTRRTPHTTTELHHRLWIYPHHAPRQTKQLSQQPILVVVELLACATNVSRTTEDPLVTLAVPSFNRPTVKQSNLR